LTDGKSAPRATIRINRKLCKECGICIAFCPKQVLAADRVGGPEVVRPELCIACGLCVLRCPDFAVEMEENA